ncbi:MAG TPA: disulfide bond formation protein B [Sphingorhabdus sp.]|mgnify:CR=1 FL=1|jgi:disulfide bond formation protein DsbB|uniref:disulfide bond formation protein B n=1 Tax=Sphingorhabdus sp. TaxID=1902408 RepID=UPI002BCCDAC4|nr:disulfide bond formation protein B [Sphingorhabdus sp.]HMT40251.1 disulfide bond formation protein B [Sphingorhabdus sp.]HMU20875.1 disulfide bond formation protein B [Sphingorhabdus sp.]
MTGFDRARWLALLLPLGLLGGAYASQYIGGLYPCEMCWWQRWPHFAALPLALAAFVASGQGLRKTLVLLAALAILTSGLIGGYHAGVEYGWWEGITTCSSTVAPGSGKEVLDAILNAPLIRCDIAPWTLFGISLAGYNFLISTFGAFAIFGLLRKGAQA